MIGQVLNRSYVLSQLDAVRRDLEKAAKEEQPAGNRRRGPGQEPFQLEKSHFGDALEAINGIEQNLPHGQKSFSIIPSERRGPVLPPALDEYAFLCWDPTVSLLQTAVERYYLEKRQDALVRIAPPRPGFRMSAPNLLVTDLFIKGGDETAPPRRILDQFSITDIRWVSCWVAEGVRLFRNKHPFNPVPATPLQIRDDAQIILVGDWGTGLPRAKKVAVQMRAELAKGKAEGIEQHVIHLGDVYYSGWKDEYLERFLAPDCWPVRDSDADTITSWSLNGNHDMYSGGHAYYDVLLADKRFKKQERSSFFSLTNNHWEILGLDTSWEDEGLQDPQASWVTNKIYNSTKNVMLLSHHQLFSAYEHGCPKLAAKLAGALATDHIRAWFWGHEHRCMAYDPSEGVVSARCLGHGGVPVYMTRGATDGYKKPGNYEFREFIQKGLERWALFGFAVLRFQGPKISVRYIDENGREHRNEIIP